MDIQLLSFYENTFRKQPCYTGRPTVYRTVQLSPGQPAVNFCWDLLNVVVHNGLLYPGSVLCCSIAPEKVHTTNRRASQSQCKGRKALYFSSLVEDEERMRPGLYFVFTSVLWHCWLSDWWALMPHTYLLKFFPGTSGRKLRETGQARFTWKMALNEK